MRKILIVDDNTTLAYFTARNLERDVTDLTVSTAAGCSEAWKELRENAFSVVIVDFNLSDGNGIDLINQIHEQFPEVSAILISGQARPQELKSNIYAFLLKPYEAKSLSDLVLSALAEQTGTADVRPRTVLETPSTDCAGYNSHHVRNQLSALLVGLRSFGADLRSNAHNPEEVGRTVEEYLDKLCNYVHEVGRELPECKAGQKIGRQ